MPQTATAGVRRPLESAGRRTLYTSRSWMMVELELYGNTRWVLITITCLRSSSLDAARGTVEETERDGESAVASKQEPTLAI